jgi:hypothetical protein
MPDAAVGDGEHLGLARGVAAPLGNGTTNDGPTQQDDYLMQIFWSLTAIASVFALVFIATR